MLQLENRCEDYIQLAIYPKNILERFRLFFCNRILVTIDLTTDAENNKLIETHKPLEVR